MRESVIQTGVVKHARAKGCLAVKMSVGGGFPDYMFLYEGRVLFIEFKAPNGHPTALQKYMHGLLRGKGFEVHVVKDILEGVMIINVFTQKGT